MTPARLRALHALLEAKRVLHPELRPPVRFGDLRRVLWREQIALVIQPHPRVAQLLHVRSGWTMIVDERASIPERTIGVCHELAHLWRHHDARFDRTEGEAFDRSSLAWNYLEEEEADALAEMMVAPIAEPRERYVKTYEPRPRAAIISREAGECPTCGIEYGQGEGRVPRAVDRDECVGCAALSTVESGNVD